MSHKSVSLSCGEEIYLHMLLEIKLINIYDHLAIFPDDPYWMNSKERVIEILKKLEAK